MCSSCIFSFNICYLIVIIHYKNKFDEEAIFFKSKGKCYMKKKNYYFTTIFFVKDMLNNSLDRKSGNIKIE